MMDTADSWTRLSPLVGAVARDQGQGGRLPAVFPGAERSACTSSKARIGAALQGPYPDRGSLEADVPRANGQGFENPGAGVGERERKTLVGRSQRSGGGLENTPACLGGEVPAAVGVDELKIANQARHFASHNVR